MLIHWSADGFVLSSLFEEIKSVGQLGRLAKWFAARLCGWYSVCRSVSLNNRPNHSAPQFWFFVCSAKPNKQRSGAQTERAIAGRLVPLRRTILPTKRRTTRISEGNFFPLYRPSKILSRLEKLSRTNNADLKILKLRVFFCIIIYNTIYRFAFCIFKSY